VISRFEVKFCIGGVRGQGLRFKVGSMRRRPWLCRALGLGLGEFLGLCMAAAMGMIGTDWGYRRVPPRLSATTVYGDHFISIKDLLSMNCISALPLIHGLLSWARPNW
jgi:hypothetical protein